MDDDEPDPAERNPNAGTSALILEWWREEGAEDEEERERALRGNLWDISPRRRKLGAFAGFDGLVALLRRLLHDPHE